MRDLHTTVEAVKKRLEEYRSNEREIENQTERLERLKTKITDVGAQNLSGMPHSPSPSHDRYSEYIYRKEELVADIDEMVTQNRKTRTEIEDILKHISKPDERAVIRSRYIDAQEWCDVNDMLHGGKYDFHEKEENYYRRMMYIHSNAISSIANYILESGSSFCDEI